MRKFSIIAEIFCAVAMIVLAIIRVAMGDYALAIDNMLFAILASIFAAVFWKAAKDEKLPYSPKVTAKELVNILRASKVQQNEADL